MKNKKYKKKKPLARLFFLSRGYEKDIFCVKDSNSHGV